MTQIRVILSIITIINILATLSSREPIRVKARCLSVPRLRESFLRAPSKEDIVAHQVARLVRQKQKLLVSFDVLAGVECDARLAIHRKLLHRPLLKNKGTQSNDSTF